MLRATITVALFLVPPVLAQERLPLDVAFVGKPTEARGKAYVDFLTKHCRKVTAHSRHDVAPGALKQADVVIVDWPQGEGVMKWFGGKEKPFCPLGKRSEWDRPTVLVGSAGLNVACAWDVKGSSG